ncbi:glucose 1-dehydrogenase [Kitasatospora aureofaciens]|uniref:3-ketoacyl-ACP reductase n=1 Tax=Kitasatospora aureofaciens TaxID=1894 RepID=A0A1E7N183_KITAU|nr:glucose 1-dehydrogenase [Kitasatospora aureofaciens]ARF82745.1 3-ketoacyl-ACP reductase [Kitasatospora aureofaciens]OEV34436.1 3-ketoacyl-ACP reductase [Kitasatospora aureofaciens]
MVEGKAAVVTGGSRGIGRAIVERLAREGADVVLGYANDRAAAEAVVGAVAAAGGRAWAVRADLGESGAAEQLMAAAEERLGGLDILVNNAAKSFTPTPLADLDDAAFDAVLSVNTRAVLATVRYAARRMRDSGRIVNISSVNTARAVPGIGAYAASKGAVEQLTAVAAAELGPRGITVNTVSPGATDTDLLRGTNPPEALERVAGLTPLRRLGQPEDIADVVAFLAGPDARWITGQNLRATGGLG